MKALRSSQQTGSMERCSQEASLDEATGAWTLG